MKFYFNLIDYSSKPAVTEKKEEDKEAEGDDDEDQPPPEEVKPVKEDDAFYSIKYDPSLLHSFNLI